MKQKTLREDRTTTKKSMLQKHPVVGKESCGARFFVLSQKTWAKSRWLLPR